VTDTSVRREEDEESASAVLVTWLLSLARSISNTGRRGILCSVIGLATGVTIALLVPSQYTSSASFIARGASSSLLPSSLQGLAATVGIGSARDYSPQFYADLVTSDPVLTSASLHHYDMPGMDRSDPKTYLQIEGFLAASPSEAEDAALRQLRRRVAARADVRTNIVSVSATARYPALSRDLVQALLDALDSINISFRQEQSRELRQFFESRVANAQHDLDSTESALREFLERNRATQNSPLLTFEQVRLTRAADLKRALYTTVVQQYEEAKMQEARNVPILTVLSPPTLPVRKSGPPRRFIAATGFLLGLLVALAWDQVGTRLRQSRSFDASRS
jgi:uncharacterized protein involved in exopolysaccharide biosynthesis